MNDLKRIGEILENKTELKLDKCKYCGKPYEYREYKIFKGSAQEKTIRMQVPTCNCIELEEKRALAKQEAEYKKQKLEKLFENSLITPFFQKKTFENLAKKAAEKGNEKELGILINYAKNFSKEKQNKGVFLIGKTGSGKTSLIAGVCNDLMARGFNVLFITFSGLMEKFTKYSADNNGDIYPLLMWLVKFDFIVIDDIGRENYTDRRKEIAYRIIDTILNYEVPAAFTANPEMITKLKKIEDWDAILDRLKDICGLQIIFKGESQRGRAW